MSGTENIKSILSHLGSKHSSSPLTFPQLDVEKLKIKLNLKDLALERGAQNLPSTEDLGRDDIEQRIVNFLNDEIADATEAYYDNQRAFEVRINELASLGSIGKIDAIATLASSDFKAQIHKRQDELYHARGNVTAAEKDLVKFKEKNGLDQTARYPESKLIYFAVAIFFMVIETYINGQFFAKGHELGMIGGFFTAFIPSLLNVLLGLGIGHFALRLLGNVSATKRIMGTILLFGLTSIVTVMNLAVAHYRSAMVAMVENADQKALENFLASPFSLGEVESWLLMLMGMVFCTVATIDFWKMDDPYVGYGAISRAHQEALNRYATMKSDAIEDLQDFRDNRIEELDTVFSYISSRYNQANAILDSQRRWETLFAVHLDHLEGVGRDLVAYYRNTNQMARTENVPAYFNAQWSMDRKPLPQPNVDFARILADFQSDGNQAQRIYSKCNKQIADAFDKTLMQYQTIDQLQPEEFNKWLTSKTINVESNLATAV